MTGNEVRKLREELGFRTQKDLADAMGCVRVTISNWERCKGRPITKAAEKRLLQFVNERHETEKATVAICCPHCGKSLVVMKTKTNKRRTL